MIAGSDLISYLLSAGGISLLFLLAAVLIQATRGSRTTRIGALLIAIALAFFSIYTVQFQLSRLLVGNLRPFEAGDVPPGGRIGVVVLGSGSKTVEDWSGRTFSVVDRSAAARVLEAARVYAVVHPDVVISSGGEPHPEYGLAPSGTTMRDAMISLGIPPSKIVLETVSKTTRDEAVVIAPMLSTMKIDRVVLVTSEAHMRRSLGVFRAAGIRAIPAIAQELEPVRSWWVGLLPTQNGIEAGRENLHEVLGIVYYRLRGWWTE